MAVETGSLFNNMMAEAKNPEPEVGMGCTILGWTDRHAATIIDINKTGKTITIQRDDAKRTDGNGMSDMQTWEYKPDPQGAIYKCRKNKKGEWKIINGGSRVAIGYRAEYYDFSF